MFDRLASPPNPETMMKLTPDQMRSMKQAPLGNQLSSGSLAQCVNPTPRIEQSEGYKGAQQTMNQASAVLMQSMVSPNSGKPKKAGWFARLFAGIWR